jgi:hypothetical protein
LSIEPARAAGEKRRLFPGGAGYVIFLTKNRFLVKDNRFQIPDKLASP